MLEVIAGQQHLVLLLVSPNTTDRLQPLDLSVNKPAKDFMKKKFQDWYGAMICKQLEDGVEEVIDLRLSVMKPLCANWCIEMFHYLVSNPDIIIKAAGIVVDILSDFVFTIAGHAGRGLNIRHA